MRIADDASREALYKSRMTTLPTYSIVVPVFCEEGSLDELTRRVDAVFSARGDGDDFELIFVDDGSTDGTSERIAQLSKLHPFVRGVMLRVNCGKSLALMAGFSYVRGAIVVQMDGDLQDCPEDIPRLLETLDQGWDMVSGWRQNRQDTLVRRLGSKLYNAVVGNATRLRLHDHNCGMKAYRREVVDSLCIYGQYHRYVTIQVHLLGFKVTEVPVSNDRRKHGVSKFRTMRYQGLLDLMSILFTHHYGNSPLHFFGVVSALFIFPGVLAIGYWTVEHLMWLLGFGDQYLFRTRPLFNVALTAIMLGVIIFLTGFVCDFILHHQIRKRMPDILKLRTRQVVDGRREDEHSVSKGP